VEIMRAPAMTMKDYRKVADYDELFSVLRRQQETGRGAIFAFPHMGSWELAGRALLLQGMPVFSVAGKQRNPLFDSFLNATREKMGVPITMRGASTLRTIINRLKSGGMLAMLPDVRMRTEAVTVTFLGKEANVGAGMALFARHAGVPIYPLIMSRVGWTQHRCRTYMPVHSDPGLEKQDDVQRMTQQVLDIISQAILADPSQWFWYNKRWVLEPVEPTVMTENTQRR
jgi:KDO2-lipid IV(A) lauroyltransferase